MRKTNLSELSEFLPAAIEVRERAAHPATHYTAATIAALLLILLAWAYWGEIDIVARAEGKIIPSGQVRPVQAAEAGVVSDILVSEGQFVGLGETLLRLSPKSLQTEIERAQIELDRLQQLESRERQMLEYIDLNEQDDLLPVSEDVQLLEGFAAYQSRLSQLERAVAEREAARERTAQSLARLSAIEPLVRERVDALSKLARLGHASHLDYLSQQERLIELHYQQKTAQAEHRQIAAELAARRNELSAFSSETRAEKLALIEQHRSAIAIQQQLLKQLSERRVKLDIRAAISGRVKDLTVFASGAVVGASEQVMSIVPQDEKLEVEAWLENRDIGFVSAGDASELKLETFPFTKYGVLQGEVIELSADATQTDAGLIYKARIALNSREIEVDNRVVSLMPGMGVTAEIQTGRRRVIDYLFDPLMRYQNESLRER